MPKSVSFYVISMKISPIEPIETKDGEETLQEGKSVHSNFSADIIESYINRKSTMGLVF